MASSMPSDPLANLILRNKSFKINNLSINMDLLDSSINENTRQLFLIVKFLEGEWQIKETSAIVNFILNEYPSWGNSRPLVALRETKADSQKAELLALELFLSADDRFLGMILNTKLLERFVDRRTSHLDESHSWLGLGLPDLVN
jgi:hypothetical protein